jgi:autotransporter-associated beta strand protein
VASALNLNGGTLQYTGTSIATTHTVALGGNGGTFDVAAGSVLTLSGVISGLGLTINNSDGGNGTVVLGGTNTFTGGIWINAGVVQLNNAAAISATGFNTLTFGTAATATLQLNSRSSTVAGLTSPSASAIVENANATTAATLTVDNGADNTFAGVLRDGTESVAGSKALSVAKTGGGALALSGANTYTGATTISGGTVVVSGSISGSTAVTVNAASLLLSGTSNRLSDATSSTVSVSQGSTLGYASGLSGKSELAGGLSLSGGAALDFGNGNTNTLTFNGLTLTGTLAVKNWSGGAYNLGDIADHGLIAAPSQDRLLFNTDPGFALGTEIASISFYDDAGVFLGHGEEVNLGGQYEIVAVPEPSSVTLLGAAGLLGVAGFRRRRKATGMG